ncbi:MAG: hypothetical protein NTU44_18010 [Bacteroidetes bacterium]|nr:hypothetical protein [Bacteroidota bacterium]
MKQEKFTQTLFCLLMVLFLLPFFQGETRWINVKRLNGAIENVPRPGFTWKTWIGEEFQHAYEPYINQKIGFRPDFIRINNQLDFSLYGTAHANQVIIGKKNYLYELNYIKDYTGENLVAEEVADEKFARLRFVQYALKKKNIDLVILIAPGKATFYPEYIPDQYLQKKKGLSNYLLFIKRCKELELNNIDFNDYFLKIKDTVAYPIYPKCGIHWSQYGMALCADSLFRFIEKLRGIRMIDFGWDGLEISRKLRDTDDDIGEGMNLLFPISSPPGAYPRFYFRERPGDIRPDAIVIGDSFWWTVFGKGISGRMFNENKFWFYFADAYDGKGGSTKVNQLDLKKELDSTQLVLLLSTEASLSSFFFGFAETVYPLYFPENEDEQFQVFRNLIQWDKGWLGVVRSNMVKSGRTLDEEIDYEARTTLLYKDSLKATGKDIDRIVAGIMANKEWMGKETQKAGDRKISVEKMLRDDAQWIFNHNSKTYRKKYWPGYEAS